MEREYQAFLERIRRESGEQASLMAVEPVTVAEIQALLPPTPRELFATELNARLVVLAACETGPGKLSRGDELVGLQRAFLYAGTPAVLTTLWKVDDRASYALMRRFYDGLGPHGVTETLRAAQRALLVDFPHPFAWAAFSVTGAAR